MLLFSLFSIILLSTSGHGFGASSTEIDASTNIELPFNASVVADIRQLSAIEGLFGQVAKTVVYGGATLLRINSRILCPLLSHETRPDNADNPILYVFNNHDDRQQAYRIYADDDVSSEMMAEAGFDANQMTVFYVHGWLGGINNEFWLNMAKDTALGASLGEPTNEDYSASRQKWQQQLKRIDRSSDEGGRSTANATTTFRPNVIVVDWSELADGSLYAATKNSFRVARRLARLMTQLAAVGRLKPELMHCMGHSIGAHICGRAARDAFPAQPRLASLSRPTRAQAAQNRMGRITGLDPGGFCYELGVKNETTYLGLKPSDALLVDAYYSNRTPLGNRFNVAHYNVYLNNGYWQRQCAVWRNPEFASEYFRSTLRVLMGDSKYTETVACDHYFATRFAHQNLLPGGCSYVAYACDSYRNFLRGQCGLCDSPTQCYTMDMEYQRPRPSVSHALEMIANYSSLMGAHSMYAEDEGPVGGVPYVNRRPYYIRVTREEPYCSINYRLRVLLNQQHVDNSSTSGFVRSDTIKLRLLGAQEEVVSVRDASSGKMVDTISLHGPWTSGDAKTIAEYGQVYGVDKRTLTALIELAPSVTMSQAADGRFLQAPITDIVVIYDSDNGRRSPPKNPIESIKLDYLSSSDRRIRSQNSRAFPGHSLRVFPSHS